MASQVARRYPKVGVVEDGQLSICTAGLSRIINTDGRFVACLPCIPMRTAVGRARRLQHGEAPRYECGCHMAAFPMVLTSRASFGDEEGDMT